MSKQIPTPGTYSLTEVAEGFSVSRKTAERYEERFSILTDTIMRYGKEVKGLQLTQDIIDNIVRFNQQTIPGMDKLMSVAKPDDIPLPPPVQMVDHTILEDYRTRLDTVSDENSQLKIEISDLKVKNALIEGELKSANALAEELRNRIQDKDVLILSLQREAELEKNRAEQFNNQLSSAHSKIQEYKSQEQFMRDLKKQVEALQAAQNITIKTETAPPVQDNSKSFSFFGFEIRRSK